MKGKPNSSTFSIRLVSADYYLSYPIPELDIVFSEFRGSEIKQLPILRIFGATPEGRKTCLHVHGVFPYLYIPCEDPHPEPKIAYQIANSIDKAINISLNQGNAINQHVYRVTLVQGIPFYGFHTKPHQFYKIFFYNPSFIKRAADLLQSGAILGLSYQPHEAHINFTMQFFLDFNLYGMSFINMEYVKFRRKPNTDIDSSNDSCYLPESVPFTSCCEWEVDCLAQHILNRKDVINGNLGTNPGLAALWDDEKQRLNNLNMTDNLMPTPTQLRDNIKPTESHIYHSKKLLIKLAMFSELRNEMSDSSISLTILNDTPAEKSLLESNATSSLGKPCQLLKKMIYPAETPDDNDVMNATNITLHHPLSIFNNTTSDAKKNSLNVTCSDLNDTIVDESIILQCTQSQEIPQIELDSEDIDLMNMLNDMEKNVEEDSVLGTQAVNTEDESFTEADAVECALMETESIKSNKSAESSPDSLIWQDSFWEDVENISQLDGASDDINEGAVAPPPKIRKQLKLGLSKPRRQSQRNTRPVINTEPVKNPITEQIVVKSENDLIISPKKSIDFIDKLKNFQIELSPKKSPRASPKNSPSRRSRNFEPLRVSIHKSPSLRETYSRTRRTLENISAHVYKQTLLETPTKSKKKLKTSPGKQLLFESPLSKMSNEHTLLSPSNETREHKWLLDCDEKSMDHIEILSDDSEPENKYSKQDSSLEIVEKFINIPKEEILLDTPQNNTSEQSNRILNNIKDISNSSNVNDNQIESEFQDFYNKTTLVDDFNKNIQSDHITSSMYDREHNYVPQAGPSKVYVQKDTPYVRSPSPLSASASESQIEDYDPGIVSFYNTTNILDSSVFFENVTKQQIIEPTKSPKHESNTQKVNKSHEDFKLWYDHTIPEDIKLNGPRHTGDKLISDVSNDRKIVLTPRILPPSRSEIIATMMDYKIPLCINQEPFYSNCKDVRGQIEIGQIVLKLKSKHMADMKPFVSSIPGLNSIEKWREMVFMENNMSQDFSNVKDLSVLLASNRSCILTPVIQPPSVKAVKNWLKTKNDKKQENLIEEVQEKILYCMPCSPGQELNNSQLETLTLSPFSPASVAESLEDVDPVTPQPIVKSSDKILLTSGESKKSENSDSNIKSTAKKRKALSQPMRRLRPRALQMSLRNRLSLDGQDSVRISEGLSGSQGSNESDYIACGQYCNILDSPIQEKPLAGIVSPNLINSPQPEKNDEIIKSPVQGEQYESINVTENLSGTLGFKFSGENYQDVLTANENEFITTIVLEVITSTRGDLNPDPEIDPVLAAFYSIKNDCPSDYILPQTETGIFIVKDDQFTIRENRHSASCHLEGLDKKYCITLAESEKDLFEKILELITKWDPDILCGYEIEMLSWGYLFQRGFTLDINLPSKISRVPPPSKAGSWKRESQEAIKRDVKLIGRITLDVWRLLRHEIALTSYTFENVMYHIMHERVPEFSFKKLFFWWNHPSGLLRSLSVEYYLTRVMGVIQILQQLDLIGRTSELARLFGIQWYEVLSRGSQFRVESMMIRMTRPRNFVLVSPSVQQRAAMKAPECLPLILEPESRFYSDPVIVLDFQSLYPSMMIAYNYCFSTCIGKVQNMGKDTPYEFGASQLRVSPRLLEKLNKKDLINWSPCGIGFIKPALRKGVLPIMLQDILNTRLMVKRAMKKHKDNKTLQKILHSRQLGLKLIANVTYGYTAANFSGRMPCIEVGDSVVAKGRETLERAIRMVEDTPKWKAKVVYGDTDSLFVLVAGRSRSDAFDIGAEIAEAVTNDNPTPVKLKLEKIYQPCILQTKKRYVGYMYESKSQETPEYNAKGIETVRRDGCPATAKMLEKTLKILFETYDVSKIKSYICREFQKIIEGRCNIRDFIFAKEFRGMNAYKPTASIPALEIARRLKAADHRKEPREGERVPYIIVSGGPEQVLLRLAHCPRDLLEDPSLKLHHAYYINRVIAPPLNRCLTLIGADVLQWLAEMPRKMVQLYPILDESGKQSENKKSTISQYFAKVNCVGCESQTTGGVCNKCLQNPQRTLLVLQNKINEWQRRFNQTNKICQSCCGRATQIDCISMDCPVLFRRNNARQDVGQIPFMLKVKQKVIEF